MNAGSVLSVVAALSLGAVGPATLGQTRQPITTSGAKAAQSIRNPVSYGKLPLSFEPNLGQTSAKVQWLARGPEYTLYLAGNDAVLQLNKIVLARRGAISPQGAEELKPRIFSSAVRMNLLGARTSRQATGENRQSGNANYFTGNDSSKWQRNVPMFGEVRLKQVYPGIDLVYYGQQGQLEYDFVVAPGADASAIRMNFDGAKAALAENGDLVLPIERADTEVRFHKPVVYQMKDGVREPVDGSFVIAKNRQVSFKLSAYDKRRELVIDPELIFLGALATGNQETIAEGMALDSSGEIILTGITEDLSFPVTTGALQTVCNTDSPVDHNLPYARCGPSTFGSAFVTKISADGTSLVYSTYLHGLSGNEYGEAVAVDASGDAYVLGATSSNDFPVTANAYQSVCQPEYQTVPGPIIPICDGFFAGGGTEYTVDGPTLFVAELNPAGSALVYSTFFGGTVAVSPVGIALDSSNNIYFAGYLQNAESTANVYPNSNTIPFPVTGSAYQAYGVGSPVATLSVLSAGGHSLIYSTLMGTALTSTSYVGITEPLALALGPNGMAYLAGQTNSLHFPTTPGVVTTSCPAVDPSNLNYEMCAAYTGFLSAFDTTKSGSASLVYSTFIGAAVPVPAGQGTSVYGVAADSSNNAYVTGYTSENNYPVTPSAILPTCRENPNEPVGQGTCAVGFLSKINPNGTAFVWSTFFGGTAGSTSQGNDIAFDGKGQVYLYGYNSNYGYDLPLVNPIEPRPSGSYAFIAAFSADGNTLLFSTPIGNQSAPTVNIYPVANNGIALDGAGNIYFGAYGADSGAMVTTSGTYATADPGNSFQRSFFGKISSALDPYYETGQLTIPSITEGAVTYFNVVVTISGIVSGPSGSAPIGTAVTYNPANGELSIPAATVGNAIYFNVVVKVSGFVSIGGVTGADTYNGSELTIASVHVLGGATYEHVVVKVAKLDSIGGGAPAGSVDQYNPATQELVIPAVEYAGKAYTNVTVTVGTTE